MYVLDQSVRFSNLGEANLFYLFYLFLFMSKIYLTEIKKAIGLEILSYAGLRSPTVSLSAMRIRGIEESEGLEVVHNLR